MAPFAAWALSGGQLPLAIGVLQILALDIGTDMLPALALGAEPPSEPVMKKPVRDRVLIDAGLLRRALLVLGLTEAACALIAFIAVLFSSGWHWGTVPAAGTLAMASGATFAAIALGQMANAFACRSDTVPVWRLAIRDNLFVVVAVAAELLVLVVFLGFPPLARLLGGSPPPPVGWICAFGAASLVIITDATHKYVRRRRLSPQDQ